MKNRILYIIIAALVAALLFSIQRCSHNNRRADTNFKAATDTIMFYKNKVGSVTASLKMLQLDKNQMKNLLLKKDADIAGLASEFASLKNIITYQTITKIDTIPIIYRDTVPYIFKRAGKVNGKWYSFTYTSNQNSFIIDSLIIPNTANVITGTKRKWFLGKQTLTTDITNTNPYINVTGATAAEIAVAVPWYKKWWIWFIAGLAGGYSALN